MTARPAFGAKVASHRILGTLLFDDEAAWNSYLRGLAGKRVRVVVSRETKGRTLPQNAWLWSGVYPYIVDWSGHILDEVHEFMKDMFGVKVLLRMPNGLEYFVPKSTADYTTEEMSTYIEYIRAFAAQQGINIPDPGRCA